MATRWHLPTPCLDETINTMVRAEFLAQMMDMNLNRVAVELVTPAIEFLLKHLIGQDLAA